MRLISGVTKKWITSAVMPLRAARKRQSKKINLACVVFSIVIFLERIRGFFIQDNGSAALNLKAECMLKN
ncbi:hypothetical protein BN128_4186 [Cronobacter sakazakii 696]|nr:hypothetical protein BN128_4186 [Cronobacter sakazakii 696]